MRPPNERELILAEEIKSGAEHVIAKRLAGPDASYQAYAAAASRVRKATAAKTVTQAEPLDVAAIVNDELDRLGKPLPAEVARAGPGGVYSLALQLLGDDDIETAGESVLRRYLRRAIKQLVSNDVAVP